MNLEYSFTNIVYNSFDNCFQAVNIHIAIEFVFVIKYNKKSKKKILCKVWLKYNKKRLYKAKRYKIRQTIIMKNVCCCKVFTTYYCGKKT